MTVTVPAISPHEEMALDLADALGEATPAARERTRAALAAVAVRIPPDLPPGGALGVLARVVGDHVASRHAGEVMLPAVLARGEGSPAAVAVLAASVGVRAGLAVDLVRVPGGLAVAHPDVSPWVYDPARSRPGRPLLDGHLYGTDVPWCCVHTSRLVLLGRTVAARERAGDLLGALHASMLRLALELPEDEAEACRADHARLAERVGRGEGR